MATRILDLGLSVFASVVALFLSWPYWRDFQYWAESRWAWLVYFALGLVLAVYVFYVFLIALRTLFEHDELERIETIEAARNAIGAGEERS
jgi:hypothetical protein